MRSAAFLYADVLASHTLRDDHVLLPTRLRYTYELLQAYHAFQMPGAFSLPPRQATEEELLTFHTQDYVKAVQAFSRGDQAYNPIRFNFSKDGDNPIFPGMYEASAWSTGASLRAAELLFQGQVEVAANFAGGLHHAMPGYASGFCVFNDPVVAIKALLGHGFRVAYVDIDCHHGDGVQYAFYETDRVLTISLHESGQFLFPGTGTPDEIGVGKGQGYSVNVPLYPFTDDDIYHWAFREVVPPLLQAFQADVLVTQLGIDTHFSDPITHLQLTVQGYGQVVQELARFSPGRWLALGGGGYDIAAVVRAWTLAFGLFLGTEWPDEIPEGYRERYGFKYLTDHQRPNISPDLRRQAQQYAEQSVRAVQRMVFPYHGLSALA